MLNKTLYRVKGKKINVVDETGVNRIFLKGEEFEAYPQCVPVGFLDLVDVLGPAEIKKEVEGFEEEVPLKRIPPKSKEEFTRTTRLK